MSPARSQANELHAGTVKLRVFGAGTSAMLIVLFGLIASQLFSSPKVTIERKIEPGAGAHIERRPSPAQLIAWSTELQLTAVQIVQIKGLDKEEKLSLAPVGNLIKKAEREFDLLMREQTKRALVLAEIQAKAKPLSELGLKKRQLESKFAAQAFEALTNGQKTKVQELWQRIRLKGKVVTMEAKSVE